MPEIDLDIRTIFFLILRNLWLILLSFIVLFVGAFFVFEYKKTPLYTAEATMYISNKANAQDSQTNTASVNDLNTAQQLINTYSIVLKSNYAIDAVLARLGNGYNATDLRRALSLDAVSETEVMSITATTDDPQLSTDICNAVVAVAPEILRDKVKVGTCELIDEAVLPTKESNPLSFKTPAVAGLLGAVLAAAAVILSYLFGTKIKSAEDFRSRYDLVILGEIPNLLETKKQRGKSKRYYQSGARK